MKMEDPGWSGLREVTVGSIAIDSATLIVGDPLYVDNEWIKLSEAAPDGISFGGGIGLRGREETNSRVVGEKLEAEGHRVEWADAARSMFTAWPAEALGLSLEQFRSRVLAMIGGASAPGSRMLAFNRPSGTLRTIQQLLRDTPAVAIPFRLGSPTMCAGFRLGQDGQAIVRALVDDDNFVRRIIIDCG